MNFEDEKLYSIKDGITKLIDYSKRNGNSHLASFLNQNHDTGRIKIYRLCQKDVYNALKRKSTELICTPRECKPARRESINFSWICDCFYCGEVCKVYPHNPNRIDWSGVRALPMKENILHECLRNKGEQSEALRMQLLIINDLVAAEGRYHKNCRQIFFMKVQSLWEEKLMLHVMRVYTLGEIHQKMVDLAGSKEPANSTKWMRKKLKEWCKEHANFVAADGKTTKVCSNDKINEKWYEKKLDDKDDLAQRIIITAAKLAIRSKKYQIRISGYQI